MSDILAATGLLLAHKELAVLEILRPFKKPVLVAGAYKGDTIHTLQLMDPYVDIHAFEPQSYCQPFLKDLQIHLHSVALGNMNTNLLLHGKGTDFASLVDKRSLDVEMVQMVEAKEYLKKLNVTSWSLLLFNMEGYEYTLIPYLDQAGVLDSVDNLLVQYHPKVVTNREVYHPEGFNRVWDRFPAWIWWSKTFDQFIPSAREG